MIRYGVAIPEIPQTESNSPINGGLWASIAGEPARRYEHIKALDSGVIWMLDAPSPIRNMLLKRNNFNEQSGVVYNTFLRTSIKQISEEIFQQPAHVLPSEKSEVISSIFSNVMTFATKSGITLPEKYKNYMLNQMIGRSILGKSNIDINIHNAFMACATHQRASVGNKIIENDDAITLRRNRFIHGKELLTKPVPEDAPWRLVPSAQLPTGRNMATWIESIQSPFFVQCDWHDWQRDVSDVVVDNDSCQRQWWTDVEWKTFREWGNFTVKSILVCDAPWKQANYSKYLPENPMSAISYSAGLFAEQLWIGLTAGHMTNNSSLTPVLYGPTAAWLRAYDRMTMLHFALTLFRQGIRITSYSAGSVVARSRDKKDTQDILNAAIDCGLIPSASKWHEIKGSHGF
jgi:hypothetical protein